MRLADINRALAARGSADRLHKGAGYFYFDGPVAVGFFDSMVLVTRISALTLDQWLERYDEKLRTLSDANQTVADILKDA